MVMLTSGLADAGVPLFTDARLREINFGALEGQQHSELNDEHKAFLAEWTFVSSWHGAAWCCAAWGVVS
jgi:broad specificity phosphatase PhoE